MFGKRYGNSARERDCRARIYGGRESVVKFNCRSLCDAYGQAGSLDLCGTAELGNCSDVLLRASN